MAETTFSDLIANLDRRSQGRVDAVIPEDWMQGRTTYGGLTAALCHEAGKRVAGDRPLKAAQISFVGPSGGEVVISPTVMREGKHTTAVSVDMVGEKGIAARCLFTFAAPRPSQLSMTEVPVPIALTTPEAADQRYFPRGGGPGYTQHFEMQLAGGPTLFSRAETADVYLWLRHLDTGARGGPYDPTHLFSIGDVPPPAALAMMREPGRISSMTWMVEFLTPSPSTEDGWWLNRSQAQTARDGYSAQSMTLWNRAGEPVMVGRQTVAIFS
ncbi:MAG: thioesterase family protein [Pseudomonadota bacterium]